MSETTVEDAARVWWKESLKRAFVRMCSVGLVGGQRHLGYLAALGMPGERIFTGYDVVDNGYFAARGAEVRDQKSKVRARYGLPDNYFLASARFIEKKNLSRLLEAYARYRELCQRSEVRGQRSEIGPDFRPPTSAIWDLVLLGDGPLRETLNSQLSTLDLHACVHMPGFKQYPELPVFYGLASAFIHASTTEQWGLVVNEAMASGLPVLVSNRCGCAPDLVREGRNGYTFDPLNVEALAQLMFGLSTLNPLQLSTFGNASQEIVANWDTERFADGLGRAAQKALEIGVPKAAWFDGLLLRGLLLQ